MSKNIKDENKEYIKHMLEQFETDDRLAEGDRMSNLSKLCILMNFLEEKSNAFEGLTVDAESVTEYTNTKALYKIIASLYDSFIRQDNKRASSINNLINALSGAGVELTEYVKTWEY